MNLRGLLSEVIFLLFWPISDRIIRVGIKSILLKFFRNFRKWKTSNLPSGPQIRGGNFRKKFTPHLLASSPLPPETCCAHPSTSRKVSRWIALSTLQYAHSISLSIIELFEVEVEKMQSLAEKTTVTKNAIFRICLCWAIDRYWNRTYLRLPPAHFLKPVTFRPGPSIPARSRHRNKETSVRQINTVSAEFEKTLVLFSRNLMKNIASQTVLELVGRWLISVGGVYRKNQFINTSLSRRARSVCVRERNMEFWFPNELCCECTVKPLLVRHFFTL